MKRHIFVSLLMFSLLLASVAGATDFYEPWQHMSKSHVGVVNAGGRTAIVTFEAAEKQNILIDRIYVKTDKSEAKLYINHYNRMIGSFETYSVNSNGVRGYGDVVFTLNHVESGTIEANKVQVLGSGYPEIPFWVGDEGKALFISAEGTTKVDILVNARRGKVFPVNPSTAVGF